MKALVQRVKSAGVTICGETPVTRTIGKGMMILFGAAVGDTPEQARKLADRCVKLRCFEDADGKMNCSVQEISGEILVVSQFTLCADTSRGNRPSFSGAARPEEAIPCYEAFVSRLREYGFPVPTGEFGAEMLVDIQNDGPVTLMLEL